MWRNWIGTVVSRVCGVCMMLYLRPSERVSEQVEWCKRWRNCGRGSGSRERVALVCTLRLGNTWHTGNQEMAS